MSVNQTSRENKVGPDEHIPVITHLFHPLVLTLTHSSQADLGRMRDEHWLTEGVRLCQILSEYKCTISSTTKALLIAYKVEKLDTVW